ncbi:MAG: hypothetical protein RL431_882 [Actinomycetota bacterium]
MDSSEPQRHAPHPLFEGLTPQLPTRAERRAADRKTRVVRATALGTIPILISGVVAALVGSPVAADANAETRQHPAPPAEPEVDTAAVQSSTGATEHTVSDGESLHSIAALHGIPTAALLALNGLSWRTAVQPGQVLVVSKKPKSSVRSTPVPVTEIAAAPLLRSGQRAVSGNGGGVIAPLSQSMTRNAQIIISVGRELGVPNFGIAIALATAMQESRLENIDYGDRDSVGLFQQRPSSGWGSVAEIMDPRNAAMAFYGGPNSTASTRNRGLLDIPGWQTMSLSRAAQSVQISAFPDAYAQWESSAWNWLFDLT